MNKLLLTVSLTLLVSAVANAAEGQFTKIVTCKNIHAQDIYIVSDTSTSAAVGTKNGKYLELGTIERNQNSMIISLPSGTNIAFPLDVTFRAKGKVKSVIVSPSQVQTFDECKTTGY